MWKTRSILNVLATLIVTRLAEAGYYEYNQDQYRQNIAPFKCTEEGYHPDPHDCKVYYRCVDWGNGSPLMTFRFECGVGTVFSKDKGDICTHPGDSGRSECGRSDNELDSNLHDSSEYPFPIWTTVRTTMRPQLITTQPPTTTRPHSSTTEAVTTIGKFETTTQSLPTSRPTTVQSEHNVINCQNGPQCRQEGFLADTCDCRKFYRCVNEGYGKFRKYNFTCGVGTVWDPEIQGCNHAWAVTRDNCKQGLETANDINSGQWNEENNGQWNNDTGNNGGQWNGNIDSPGQPGQSGDSSGYPGTSGSSGNPDFPSYPGIPGSSGTTGTPGSPGSPGFPGYVETSDSPNITPNSPGYPETGMPDSPGSPGYPGIPGSSGTSGSPGTSGISGSSGYPETSGSPAASGSSGISGSPGTPDSPSYPGTPGSPAAPDSSGTAGSPGIPDSPSYPGTPGPPAAPGSSGISSSPETSETPNSAGYPGISSFPSTPDSTGISEISSSPGYPEAPDTSGNPSSPVHPDNKPLTGPCTEEGFFADSKDCRKFYRCVGNDMSFTKYEFQCSAETAWDSSIQSCNHAYAVPHCNQPGNEPDTSLNEVDNTNELDTSKLPPMQPSESSTIPPTSSKPEIESSTQAVSTTSKSTTIPFQTTSVSYLPASTTYPLSTTQVTESISYLPPATQMTTSTSYFPSSSIATTSATSGSTPISVSYLPPDTPSTPITSTLPTPVSSTVSSPQTGKSECTEEGFFSNPDDCGKFYRCVQGQFGYEKYDFECGPGTAWDQLVQTCNHIEKVTSCLTDTNEIAQNPNPTVSNSTSESTISSSTTIASSQTTATVSSSAVSSSTLSTTIASTSSQTSTESLTPEADKIESSSTTIATSANTSEKPVSGKPEGIQMPGDSSTENSSESSSEQSISESTSESEELSTESHVPNCTTQKPNNTIVCNNDGFYPHPTRCDKFYRCVDNGNGFNVYHFDCPPGTIFDPSINVCNYPESVYPARDCTTGSTASSDSPVMSTTTSKMPEQATQIATTQSTSQQTEESTTASTESDITTSTVEAITTEQSTIAPGTESTTSEMSEVTESTSESTTESITATTEAATDSSTSEKTTEFTTESTTTSSESMEPETPTTEFQEQSTTESQEQSTTESQEQSTTESQEQSTTESQEQSTTESQEQSTTESQKPPSTEVQEQSTTQSQEQSTTESQEQTTTELSQSTTVAPGAVTPCPIGNLTDDQITLVCPTGFRRHPKYCNLFYQCTSEGNMEIKILVLSCPDNTIFDEQKIQCLPASKSSQMCTGAKTSARFYRRLEDNALSPMKVSSNQLCPGEGHFPYRQGCSNTFYKCKRDIRDNLQGYFYKCPENFVYWSVSRRCERVARLPMCSHLTYRNKTDWNNRWQIPTEDFNLSAKMLRFS